MSEVRVVNGLKVAFVEEGEYFKSFSTPSMYSTARKTGADVVVMLSEGVTAESLTDEELFSLFTEVNNSKT